jgi:hypothetical protein
MAHEVFISHALRDRAFVAAICKSLESAQVKCWIAERDISTGEDWTEATRNAIASSRLMVLVLSENANAAPHLEREIAHAFYIKRPIFPVRITDTPPKRDFLFYLGNVRWFDAFNSSPKQYLEELTDSIRGILRGPPGSRDIKPPPKKAEEAGKRSRGLTANSTARSPADSSASKSAYSYTRLGLWVPSSVGSTPSREDRSPVAQSVTTPEPTPTPSASPTPSPDSNLEQKTEPGRTQTDKSSAGNTEAEGPEDTIQGQADVPLPSPSVALPSAVPSAESTPLQAESGGSLKDSPEEQSIRELVLEYLRTMASNDSSTQGRLLAGRVDFYGKGVLSFPEIEESMERYRHQWPIRKWEPKGEPEFPNTLHSSDPDQYEVLQPFDWTVANGTKQKKGSAILYLRIRKAENGAFHIFHLEQRHL